MEEVKDSKKSGVPEEKTKDGSKAAKADRIGQIQEDVLKQESREDAAENLGKDGHLNAEALKNLMGIKVPVILLGSAIYAFGVNYFLKPLNLYSGGFMGICQLVQTIIRDILHLIPQAMDITGPLYWILNMPALIYAYMKMRRRFFYKSLLAVAATTVALAIIPVPAQPILPDYLGNAIIAGLIGGAGAGIVLRMGAAEGGLDLVGMIFISLRGKSSVGQIGMAVNMVLYTIFIFMFGIQTVIYSIIYSAFSSFACDKMHTQNISSQIMVVTGLPDTTAMETEIMGKLNRGITRLRAEGAFTGEERKVLLILVSKYEVNRMRGIIRRHDPNAFVIVNEGVNVDGHFVKRLL